MLTLSLLSEKLKENSSIKVININIFLPARKIYSPQVNGQQFKATCVSVGGWVRERERLNADR
jgi:hypothetical protein